MTDLHALLRRELDAVVADPADGDLLTRCDPWTVSDVYRHLAATFYRYDELLRRARDGRMEPPFGPDDLPAENQRAVDGFPPGLDPRRSLCEHASRFIAMATDLDELMPSHKGVWRVALQLGLGLAELAIHHDDIARARGGTYRPADDVCAAIVAAYEQLGRGSSEGGDVWAWILRASGREISG